MFEYPERSVSVIGLGYIGLPTAVVLAKSGWTVKGVDTSGSTIDMVNRGELPFVEDGLDSDLEEVVKSGYLQAQKSVTHSDVYIIAVPTPFNEEHHADLAAVEAAIGGIAAVLEPGDLVVLESTCPPGTTDHLAYMTSELRPDLFGPNDGESMVHFAHAPERVLPGRIMEEITTNDRVIGGVTTEAASLAGEVYKTFCSGSISYTDARTAELAKLAENSYRDVNIAFANELSLISDELGVDVWELIRIANRHPRVNILQPGPGVGGHCIAVDPWFIISAAPENSKLIRTAREVNDLKPLTVVKGVAEAANLFERPVIAALGLSFKANVDDLRESPALQIVSLLAQRLPNASFKVVEPNISSLPAVLSQCPNVELCDLVSAITEAQIVAILVDHTVFRNYFDHNCLQAGTIVIDTRGLVPNAACGTE